MDKIEVTLEICTLYKGIPYGLAIIKYSNPNDKFNSFKGVGVFNQGKLNKSSFTCITEMEIGKYFARISNERPADQSYATSFCHKV
jgi:hypothetical protein